MSESYQWLAINDLHLDHPHVSPRDTLENLKMVVYPLLKDIKLLTIGGDFYDSALYLDYQGSLYAVEIFNDLCRMAIHHDYSIRVIRGTYSHDRDQLSLFAQIAKRYPDIDFQYYTDLAVDVVRGYSFLYIPDNLQYSPGETRDKIRELTGGRVDCVVGHGYVDYVLPPVVQGHQIPHFTVEELNALVSEVAIMGHVHQHSNSGKVWYSGSFDRLCHGEEEDKGCLLINLERGNTKVNFIKNPMAVPHVTIPLVGDTVEDQIAFVNKRIKKLFPVPLRGYLRLLGKDTLQTVSAVLQEKYKGTLTISTLNQEQRKISKKMHLNLGFKQHHAEIPTKENLGMILYEYLNNNILRFPLSKEDIEQGLKELGG